jgi:hypothetical protein
MQEARFTQRVPQEVDATIAYLCKSVFIRGSTALFRLKVLQIEVIAKKSRCEEI